MGGRSWGGGRGAQNSSGSSSSSSSSPGSPNEAWGASYSGGQEGPPPSSGNKKLVVLSEMPPEFTVEELKKAVADQLRKFNEGQAVEIRKPASGRSFGWFLELDCRQSAEYLMQQGLYVRGRQVCQTSLFSASGFFLDPFRLRGCHVDLVGLMSLKESSSLSSPCWIRASTCVHCCGL